MSCVPKVSIIIPCYNAEAMIERCLTSCWQQLYPNIEIIIIDNNSTDGTMAKARTLASKSSHRVIFGQCSQQGANYARNYGYTLARGDYIQWLDADDELTPDKIMQQVSALEQNCNYQIAYGDWDWCFYRHGQYLATLSFQSQQYDDYLLQVLVDNWRPPHAYLLCRIAAIRLHELLAWHPQTQGSQDREYFTLAALLGYRFLHVPGALVRYNTWSETQKTQSASYTNRAATLKIMFQRLQHIAAMQPGSWITAQHSFLLKQNWDNWSLADVSIVRQKEQEFWLVNNSSQVNRPASFSEAAIVSAMQQLPGACTLEDHARRIVRWLWKAIAQRKGVESSNAIQQLNQLVGLSGAEQPDRQEFLAWVFPPGKATAKTSGLTLIDAIPLYAPVFGEQRKAILNVLEQLRQEGWLTNT